MGGASMGSDQGPEERGSRFRDAFKDLGEVFRMFYIETVPSYGNSFWFQIGFYIVVLAIVLAVTGAIMMFFGPYWWNYSVAGMYVSQIHFWAAEILVTLLFAHAFVNFSTKAYAKRKDMWVLGRYNAPLRAAGVRLRHRPQQQHSFPVQRLERGRPLERPQRGLVRQP
jgi:hypothetical protein